MTKKPQETTQPVRCVMDKPKCSWRLKLNIEEHQQLGNREQKTYPSAVCSQRVRRQANEPKCMCGAVKSVTTLLMSWREATHFSLGNPPSSSSLLRVTTACSSFVTNDQDCSSWNYVLDMSVVCRVQVILWVRDTCIGFGPHWETWKRGIQVDWQEFQIV